MERGSGAGGIQTEMLRDHLGWGPEELPASEPPRPSARLRSLGLQPRTGGALGNCRGLPGHKPERWVRSKCWDVQEEGYLRVPGCTPTAPPARRWCWGRGGNGGAWGE